MKNRKETRFYITINVPIQIDNLLRPSYDHDLVYCTRIVTSVLIGHRDKICDQRLYRRIFT